MNLPGEYMIHCQIVEWLNFSLPQNAIAHHSSNEGKHHVAFRAKQKKMGMQTGWPDLEIFAPDTSFYVGKKAAPFILEVKSKKGRLSDSQKAIKERLEDLNFHYFIVRSVEDTFNSLNGLIALRVRA